MDIEQLKLVIEMVGTIKDGAVTAFLVVIGFWVIELFLLYGLLASVVIVIYKVFMKVMSAVKEYEAFEKTTIKTWGTYSKEEAERLIREISDHYGAGCGYVTRLEISKARDDLHEIWESKK